MLSQLKKQNKLLKETVTKSINFNITNNKINFSFDKPSEIITLNSLNHCQYCNYILDYQDKNLSIITINENNHKKKMDKNWKSLLQNDKNFDQKVPYDIKSVDEKLTLASQDLEHLNP